MPNQEEKVAAMRQKARVWKKMVRAQCKEAWEKRISFDQKRLDEALEVLDESLAALDAGSSTSFLHTIKGSIGACPRGTLI